MAGRTVADEAGVGVAKDGQGFAARQHALSFFIIGRLGSCAPRISSSTAVVTVEVHAIITAVAVTVEVHAIITAVTSIAVITSIAIVIAVISSIVAVAHAAITWHGAVGRIRPGVSIRGRVVVAGALAWILGVLGNARILARRSAVAAHQCTGLGWRTESKGQEIENVNKTHESMTRPTTSLVESNIGGRKRTCTDEERRMRTEQKTRNRKRCGES